jgi:histidinol-phosphate phosphatase family protein
VRRLVHELLNEMKFKIDKSWTLFLDRDGVINEKIDNDYVKNWSEFFFINGALDALSILSSLFGNIIVVTNQRGIGKGLMSKNDLNIIHIRMMDLVLKHGGRIDKIYFCPEILNTSFCRKPNIGMAMMAKNDFPKIDFERSVMIGDSKSDMEFGKRLNMKTVFIGSGENSFVDFAHIKCSSLIEASGNFTRK